MKRILAIVLTLAVLPVPGAAGDVREAMRESDAWDVEDAQQNASETERGCSVFFHACSCHVSMSSGPAATNVIVTRIDAARASSVGPETSLTTTRSADPPPLPPPIR